MTIKENLKNLLQSDEIVKAINQINAIISKIVVKVNEVIVKIKATIDVIKSKFVKKEIK